MKTITYILLLFTLSVNAQVYYTYNGVDSTRLFEQKRNFTYPKPTDLSSESGLVAAYNMKRQGNIMTDISGTGNDGTITGCMDIPEGLSFDGVDDKILIPDDASISMTSGTDDIITVSLWFKYSGTGDMRIINKEDEYGIALNLSTNGKVTMYSFGDNSGEFGSGLNDDQWHHIVCTFEEGVQYRVFIDGEEASGSPFVTTDNSSNTANDLYIANRSASFYEGEIREARIYNDSLSLSQVEDLYNEYANQLYYRNTFKDEAVGETNPYEFIQGTGTYEIGELASDDAVISDLKSGTEYLECTSAGTIAIPSNWVYGTSEFYLYKGGESTFPKYQLINNNTNDRTGSTGYYIAVGTTELIGFIEHNNGSYTTHWATAVSYISATTWYGIQVKNETNGEKTINIKGGSFGDSWNLVDVSGGSGSNPVVDATYSTSKYIVFDLDVGDRIALLEFKKGIER